jgi:hypothetical protein
MSRMGQNRYRDQQKSAHLSKKLYNFIFIKRRHRKVFFRYIINITISTIFTNTCFHIKAETFSYNITIFNTLDDILTAFTQITTSLLRRVHENKKLKIQVNFAKVSVPNMTKVFAKSVY